MYRVSNNALFIGDIKVSNKTSNANLKKMIKECDLNRDLIEAFLNKFASVLTFRKPPKFDSLEDSYIQRIGNVFFRVRKGHISIMLSSKSEIYIGQFDDFKGFLIKVKTEGPIMECFNLLLKAIRAIELNIK